VARPRSGGTALTVVGAFLLVAGLLHIASAQIGADRVYCGGTAAGGYGGQSGVGPD
jgi:hypothetical protein